jgi:glycerol-3-phosphate dehydrogenase (NAD(P)+)
LARVGAVESAKNEVGELVEGVSTALAVHDMALRLGIELPLISQVATILNGDSSPEEAVRELLARELVPEHD